MRFARNPNFYSTSNRHGIPSVLTKTKVLDATGFPVTEKGKISVLFEDQLCNCSHRDPRIVVHVAVWFAVPSPVLAVCSSYSLLQCFASKKSGRWFSGPCIPSLLRKNSRISCIDFCLQVKPRMNDLPMQVCHIVKSVVQSTQCLTKILRYLSSLHHLSKIVLQVPFVGLRAFLSISCALKYMVCRTDGPCLAPWDGFFLMTRPGIDRTSNLSLFICRFLSVSCMHLPHVQYTMPTSQYEA